MSFLQVTIATVPVAIYFILIGSLRLRRRPLVTSGWRDLLTLGIACSGLVAVGPMQLFFPSQAASRWPGWVWVPMFVLYFLSLLILAMWSRPRLIAYGLSQVDFQDLLLKAARQIDPQASWYGEVLSLPGAGFQLSAESSLGNFVNSVGIVGTLRNVQQWLLLERTFVQLGRSANAQTSWTGWLWIGAGAAALALVLLPVISDPQAALVELGRMMFR